MKFTTTITNLALLAFAAALPAPTFTNLADLATTAAPPAPQTQYGRFESDDAKPAAKNARVEERNTLLVFPTPKAIADTNVKHRISTDVHENAIVVLVNSTNITINHGGNGTTERHGLLTQRGNTDAGGAEGEEARAVVPDQGNNNNNNNGKHLTKRTWTQFWRWMRRLNKGGLTVGKEEKPYPKKKVNNGQDNSG
ncbi:hypothetical protein FKW77_010092 [Venturia effusa]|uniref:Uncharacterized protein n=1 Tax=Venturia effusa TaxID=50376 RepID=A0A517L292_9PEZI|nr:hypothetical protein FKW77_010092 [Venturia effusa]